MAVSTERALAGLAILKVNSDNERRDLIQNFVPFVAEVLRKSETPTASLEQIQEALRDSFGFSIPTKALRTILTRVVKVGLAKREGGVYHRRGTASEQAGLAQTEREVLRQQNAVVTRLVEFAGTQKDVKWSTEEAEASLLAFLRTRSSAVLSASIMGDPLPPPTGRPTGADYVVGSFVVAAEESDPETFKFLVVLAKGSFLASALAIPDLPEASKSFERVKVFLDTQSLFRALGYAGKLYEAEYREFLELLYREGAELRCFDITVREMERVLVAAGTTLENPRRVYGVFEVYDHFRASGWTRSDVELAIGRLEKQLTGLRVLVEAVPPYREEYGLDESRLETLLDSKMHHSTPEALVHDVDVVAAIHRLRRAQCMTRLERSVAIFATATRGLVRASGRVFSTECRSVDGAVPWCIQDDTLATVVWLKKPAHAPDLPAKKLIADAYAALNPSQAIWRQYLEEVNKLREAGQLSDDDYYLLRLSTEARHALSDVRLQKPGPVSAKTVESILDKSRAAARQETEKNLQEERKKRLSAELRAQEIENRAAQLATSGARAIGGVFFVIAICLSAFATFLGLPPPFPSLTTGIWRVLRPVLLGGFALALLAIFTFGGSLKAWRRSLEVRIARRLESALRRFFGLRTLDSRLNSSPLTQ